MCTVRHVDTYKITFKLVINSRRIFAARYNWSQVPVTGHGPVDEKHWSTPILTPYSTVLLEKLTDSQVVKKFPAFYGTRRFITPFTSSRNLFLSWSRSIQSIPPTTHVPKIQINNILPPTPGSPKWFFPPGFPTKTLHTSLPPYIHASSISFFSILSPEQYFVSSTGH